MTSIAFYVKECSQNYYFEKVTIDLFDEQVYSVDRIYEKKAIGQALDEWLLYVVKKTVEQLELIGSTEEYIRFYDFKIMNPYQSQIVSAHFMMQKSEEVEEVMSQVLLTVAEDIAEGYFENLIDFLESRIDDELFFDFRLNEQIVQLEVATHNKRLILEEELSRIVTNYDESIERISTEFLEYFY